MRTVSNNKSNLFFVFIEIFYLSIDKEKVIFIYIINLRRYEYYKPISLKKLIFR